MTKCQDSEFVACCVRFNWFIVLFSFISEHSNSFTCAVINIECCGL